MIAAVTAGFIERVGLALVAPRRVLTLADEGRGGAGDLALLLCIKVLVTQTRALVAAGWAGLVVSPLGAASSLLVHLQAAIGRDLLFWLGCGAAITVLAGRRRSSGRDFDLAAVAWVPAFAIHLAVSLVFTLLEREPSAWATSWISLVAYGWMGFVALLGLRQARSRRSPAPAEAS